MQPPPERLGSFYLGAEYDLNTNQLLKKIINYDARDLTTHAVCVGMTGSGKTGLCIDLMEEAALDKVPALLIDPKGDITNLLLQFSELRPENFFPWINLDDARRKGQTPKEHSKYISNLWRNGLAEWGIGSKRISLLKKSVDFSIYTPGSDAGLPISTLSSLNAPNINFDENIEDLREQINGTVAALLGLIGVDEDPVRSREGILLSTIFEYFWRQNEDLTLEKLILSIQDPPMRQLGVFDVDTFYPEKKRFELAMSFNSLLASPSFQSWLQGEPLNIDRFLYSNDGKPRHSIFYIAHLSDRERMFFLTLLLENVLTWMRKQSGTTSLRALLYFDEIFGFLPPVAAPPSKRPLLTLLKQARAYGLGLVLVTQNPVDLDYKGLTNTGTWLIGKLQTERDKERVLQGLKGAILESGNKSNKADYNSLISNLRSRVFLMHNVHENQPVVFHTRWAMSYLRGPLTKPQVHQLMKTQKKAIEESSTENLVQENLGLITSSSPEVTTIKSQAYSTARPTLNPSVPQVFLPVKISLQEAKNQLTQKGQEIDVKNAQLIYEPRILGVASVHFIDRKHKINKKLEKIILARAPKKLEVVNWEASETLLINMSDVSKSPEQVQPNQQPFFATIPERINSAKEMNSISTDLNNWLYHNSSLALKIHSDLSVIQKPWESEREFLIRLKHEAREQRDVEVDKLEEKNAKKFDKLESKIRKLERKLEADETEYKARKREEMVGASEAVLSFFIGRRRTSAGTSAARKRRMTTKTKMKIKQTKEEINELKKEINHLETKLRKAVDQITSKWENAVENLTNIELKPRRTDVYIQIMALAWSPVWLINYIEGRNTHKITLPAYTQSDNK